MTNIAATLTHSGADYIDSTIVFGGVKKTIISKDFKGGKINILFGTTELDFTNADIKGLAVLDISQAFGEVKIIAPADWRIETDQALVMATTEDKRKSNLQVAAAGKVLILTGISVCAVTKMSNGF
jgi:hypothetical protein